MNVEYSIKDRASGIILPELDNEFLAYETGVHLGDGSMQVIPKKTHLVRYYGHRDEDWIFVSSIMPNIVKKLFNKKVSARKYPDKCCSAVCSKAIATFKLKIGLVSGDKNQLNELPEFAKKSRNLITNCLRGIADTDFGLYFDSQGYPALICTMSNKELIRDIYNGLIKLEINAKVKFNVKRYRNGKQNTEHVINIYGKRNLEDWIRKIGFSNPKHYTKYLLWKHIGFNKNSTTIQQRISIIKENDIPLRPKEKTPWNFTAA